MDGHKLTALLALFIIAYSASNRPPIPLAGPSKKTGTFFLH